MRPCNLLISGRCYVLIWALSSSSAGSPQQAHREAPPHLSLSGTQTGGAPGPTSPLSPRTASASSCFGDTQSQRQSNAIKMQTRVMRTQKDSIAKSIIKDDSPICVCAREACGHGLVNYDDLPQERVISQHCSPFYHTLCQDCER